ncbi:DUF3137 domain-containing protein [Oligoflexaceae bacterium]|nr:DUF3137 domain-containing protein [Oligoflexaceae bacterium]
MKNKKIEANTAFQYLEDIRQEIVKLQWAAYTSILIGALAFIFFAHSSFFSDDISRHSLGTLNIAIIISCVALVVFGIFKFCRLSEAKNSYKYSYKAYLVQGVVKHMRPSWSYSPLGMAKNQFQCSELFPQMDKFESDDGIEGDVEGKRFRSSDVLVKEYQGSGKNRRLVTVFRGLVVAINYEDYLGQKIFVLPDVAERSLGVFLGKFIQGANFSRPDLVNLEDPDFEKQFVVYATDSYAAHRFLTPVRMNKFCQLKQGKKFHGVSIINGVAYFAIRFSDDLFEPKINRPIEKVDVKEIEDVVVYIEDFVRFTHTDQRVSG